MLALLSSRLCRWPPASAAGSTAVRRSCERLMQLILVDCHLATESYASIFVQPPLLCQLCKTAFAK